LPARLKESIEAFLISITIEQWAFHCTNPEEYEWLKGSVKNFLEKYIPDFINNESYIFSRFNIDLDKL